MYNQDILLNAIARHLLHRHAILIGVSLMQDQCFNLINNIYRTTPQSKSRLNITAKINDVAKQSIEELRKVEAAAQAAKDPELDLELRTEISKALGNFSVGIKQFERAVLEAQKKHSLLGDKEIDEARYSMAKIAENATKFSSHVKEGHQKADEKKEKKK